MIKWLCDGLANYGHRSEVLSTSNNPKLIPSVDIDGVKVLNSRPYTEISSLPLAPSLISKTWFRANGYDIVCIHYPFPLADFAISLMTRRKFKLVVYWHSEIVAKTFLSYLVTPFTKSILGKSDLIICSSPPLLKYSKLLKPYVEKCKVVPFGIEKPDKPDTAYKKPSDSNYFIFIGRHVTYKGIETLIQGFAKFKNHSNITSEFKLKIVGSGPLLEHHRVIAKDLHVENSIDFLEHVENSELQRLLARSRCLVLSSILPSEAFALVQIEAMSHGRPIINTSVKSGVPWVARHNKEAITVNPSNILELAAAFEKMSTNIELVNQFGKSAKRRFENTFRREKFIETTNALFASLTTKTK